MSFLLIIFLLVLAFGGDDAISILKGIAAIAIAIILLLAIFNG